jgi:hypothetical protein
MRALIFLAAMSLCACHSGIGQTCKSNGDCGGDLVYRLLRAGAAVHPAVRSRHSDRPQQQVVARLPQ